MARNPDDVVKLRDGRLFIEVAHCVHCGSVVLAPEGDGCPCGAELYPVTRLVEVGAAVSPGSLFGSPPALIVGVSRDGSGFTFYLPPGIRKDHPRGRDRVFVSSSRPDEGLSEAMAETQLRIVASILTGNPSMDGLFGPVRFVGSAEQVLADLPPRARPA